MALQLKIANPMLHSLCNYMQRGKDFPFSYGAQGLGLHIKQESTNYMRCGKKLVNGIKKII